MKKLFRDICALICSAALVSAGIAPAIASAEPYEVYNYDRWGEAIPSQAGYIAERAVSGYDLGVGALSEPEDIFIGGDGTFYIADSGNNRIIAADAELSRSVRVYEKFTMPDGSKTALSSPQGVYISADTGLMYIADNQNSRVLVCDLEGNVGLEITKPESGVFDQNKTFFPQKVLADKAGNIYVVLGNITTGAAMFSPEGEFLGYYGANRVQPTSEIVSRYFTNLFTSDEKRSRRSRNVPTGITNFDADEDFIFTCTSSSTQTADTVKKLNAAGNNIFANYDVTFGDYTPMYDTTQNKLLAPAICDIDIAGDGNINCLDFTTGRIFQYDEDCNLLFITGTIAKQVGGFSQVTAVESDEGHLYVADGQKNTVTVFAETDFGRAVHKATALHNAGYYEEALEPWRDVLKYDGNYRRAYIGVASALLRKGEYKESMRYAKLADAPKIYNKAFEGYRREFLKKHFTAIAAGIAAAAAALVLFGYKHRKKRKESAHHDGPETR